MGKKRSSATRVASLFGEPLPQVLLNPHSAIPTPQFVCDIIGFLATRLCFSKGAQDECRSNPRAVETSPVRALRDQHVHRRTAPRQTPGVCDSAAKPFGC